MIESKRTANSRSRTKQPRNGCFVVVLLAASLSKVGSGAGWISCSGDAVVSGSAINVICAAAAAAAAVICICLVVQKASWRSADFARCAGLRCLPLQNRNTDQSTTKFAIKSTRTTNFAIDSEQINHEIRDIERKRTTKICDQGHKDLEICDRQQYNHEIRD